MKWAWIFGVTLLLAQAPASSGALNTAQSATAEPGPQIGPPQHPATEDQIREYLSLLGTERTARNLMLQMVASMRATAAPYYPPAFWEDMSQQLVELDLLSTYVQVYQRYVSEEDMAKIIAFYRSPAGKAILAAQPMLVRDAQDLLRQKSSEIGREVYLRHKDEIEAAKKQYEQKNAPGATSPK